MVVVLLFGGSWINRSTAKPRLYRQPGWQPEFTRRFEKGSDEKSLLRIEGDETRSRSLSPLLLPSQENRWRSRELKLLSYTTTVSTPNTAVFKNRLLSQLLHKFPFLVECWYWALIYWVYQLGRAFTAVTIIEGTVHVARRNALTLIGVEKRWHIFWELPVQKAFMAHPLLMIGINWLYSFIHIPGSIAFLIWLFYYTITRHWSADSAHAPSAGKPPTHLVGSALYEARRRTMAVCNLLAFIVFTIWPCMPPRLLSDPNILSHEGEIARSYGFVDTVHGKDGASSVWTQNRFCNQYGETCTVLVIFTDRPSAAMPSLHFGYSLLIGVTILTIPLTPQHRRSRSLPLPIFNNSHPDLAPRLPLPSWQRICCILVGVSYPSMILVAIIATANHFILDAVAGAVVCAIGWHSNGILLNLLPVEDWFLWCLRIHKPVHEGDTGAALGLASEDRREKLSVLGTRLQEGISVDS